MNKQNYIALAKKSANLQIRELKKIKTVFNKSFIQAVDLFLNIYTHFSPLNFALPSSINLFALS